MKKVNFKTVLMALFVAVAFLFVGVTGAEAQTISGSGTSVYAVPQGDFVDASEAQSLLEEAKTELRAQADGASPAMQAVIATQWAYYEAVDTAIKTGSLVPKAIVAGLTEISPDAPNGATPAQMASMKQEAIDLLSL